MENCSRIPDGNFFPSLESGEVKEAVGGIKWVFGLAKKGEVFDVISLEQPDVSTRAMFGRFLEHEDVGGPIEGDNLAFEFVAQRCPDRQQTPHRQVLRVVVAVATLHCRAFCSFLPFPPTLPFLPPNKTCLFLAHNLELGTLFRASDTLLLFCSSLVFGIWAPFHKNTNSVSSLGLPNFN